MNKVWESLKRSRTAMASLACVVLFLLTAAGFETYSVVCEKRGVVPAYDRADENCCDAPPSPQHWFGTDYLGRDVFLRAAAGSATAVKVGVIGGGLSVLIGLLLGLIAGYYGGKTDDAVIFLYSTFAAMPSLLFILAFALLFSKGFLSPALTGAVGILSKALHAEPGMLAIYLAIGLTGWVTLCRIIRSECMVLKHAPFVEAGITAGERSWKIIWKHLLPNVLHLAIIYFSLTFAGAVMSEVIVSYLGIGVQSVPSWGVMISNGQSKLYLGIWWEIAGATLFMFLLVLALNLLGDHLRDALDPKSR